MHFQFTDDQVLFRDAVRELLDKECPAAHVRAMWDSETGRAPELWAKLAEMGVVGLTVPEAHGGLGLDEVDLVLILEETGRAALPEPIVETTAVGAPLLRELGALDRLPRQGVVTVGLEQFSYVADAHVADVLVLQRGDELHALAREAVELVPLPSVDRARRIFAVTWAPGDGACIAEGASAYQATARAFERGALATAAQLLGVADRLVEVAAEYARERQQFGKPIGSFQAVKHHLANALLALEFARPVTYRAAYSVAHEHADTATHVSMAKAYASDAATLAARTALQVHGAIGYTWEHDLHLWMKRAWALAPAWGDASWHRDRVARAVLSERVARSSAHGEDRATTW
jgi:alkylation response protein AidB-like acyl-CoA dehydrogenase